MAKNPSPSQDRRFSKSLFGYRGSDVDAALKMAEERTAVLSEQVSILRAEFAALTKEHAQTVTECDNALSEIDDLRTANSNLTGKLADAERHLREAMAELTGLRPLSAKIAQLENRLADSEVQALQTDGLKQRTQDLEMELTRLQRDSQARITALQGELASKEVDQMARIAQVREETANALLQKEHELEALRQQLENAPANPAEIEVRDRMINSLQEQLRHLEGFEHEAAELRQRIDDLKPREEEVAKALIDAQKVLEEARLAAEREREMILEAAHQHADELQQRAQRRVSDESWELHRIRVERQRFIEMFRNMLVRYLDELDRAAVVSPAAGPRPATPPPPGFESPREPFTG